MSILQTEHDKRQNTTKLQIDMYKVSVAKNWEIRAL